MDEFEEMKKEMESEPIKGPEPKAPHKEVPLSDVALGPSQPQSIGIFGIIGLIIKLAPIIMPILMGLLRALDNRKPEFQVDKVKLEKLVEELTEKEIKKIVAEHRGKITPYVPTESEKARQKRMDELLKELEDAHEKSTRDSLQDVPKE